MNPADNSSRYKRKHGRAANQAKASMGKEAMTIVSESGKKSIWFMTPETLIFSCRKRKPIKWSSFLTVVDNISNLPENILKPIKS